MKYIRFISIIALLAMVFSACQETEFRTVYPESYPELTASVAETSIMYGDSITLTAHVSDSNPLSTLEVSVVVDATLICSESIRTKGNEADVTRRYHIPFGKGMPNNEPVKVYVSAINVEGYQTDMIISSTVGQRPAMETLYVIPASISSGLSTKEFQLSDAENMIFSATSLDYPNTFDCYLATKKTAFGRVDWTGTVFGMVNGEISIISQDNGDPISVSNEALVGISSLTFDAIAFELTPSGSLLEPVTALDVTTLTASPTTLSGSASQFRGGTVYFGKDMEITISGIADLTNGLTPDYFEVTGTNTAKFLGETGMYKAYYHISGDYLYVEPLPDVVYPEVLWLCGENYGRPSAPYAVTGSWNWNSPLDYAPCRKISDGVYQVTLYLENTADEANPGYGTVNFKFFHYRGWDNGEESSVNYTVSLPLKNSSVEGKVGNWMGDDTTYSGVYRITLDMNAHTTTAVAL